jgi:polyisoprenoid-binding protein YceI
VSIDTEAVPAGTWGVDKTHSNVGFAVDYMAGTFTGTFSDFDAAVADGVIKGSAKVASIQVKDANLEAHLQGPEFFDVDRHPDLTFASKSIAGEDGQLTIEGTITMKGHTEDVEIKGQISDPIADPYGGERFGLKLEAVVDRDKFGISWNNPLPSGEAALSNEVTITAGLQLVRQG